MAFYAGDGTQAAPSYSFSSDTNMGWYRESATRLSFVNGNAINATLEEGGMTMRRSDGNAEIRSTGTGTFLAGTPIYTFYNSNTSGIGCPASGSVSIITAGTERFRAVDGGGIGVGFGSETTYGTFDIWRSGAGTALNLVGASFKPPGGGGPEVKIDFRYGGNSGERGASIAYVAGIDLYAGASYQGALGFGTQTSGGNATEKARLTNGGNLLVAATTSMSGTPRIQAGSSARPAETNGVWGQNTDRAYTFTKLSVPTNATTNIFQLQLSGFDQTNFSYSRGFLEIMIDFEGEGAHDISGSLYAIATYSRGAVFRGTSSDINVISENGPITFGMTATVNGSNIDYAVTLSSYGPNHNIAAVHAYIRSPHKDLTIVAL